MKVVLLQDLEGYGVFGDVINVKDGFANNYLIPRGIALPATEGNLRHVKSIIQQRMRKLQREKEKAISLAKALEGLMLEIPRPVGEKGKLFGSVTAADISNALKEKGFDVDRKRILLKTLIKDVGIHTVQIRLHPQVNVEIKVEVKPA
ncbi:ribosomal protein L9 [Hydrogenobacter thermophilus TK-6]|uniref:Large ribosomal subunit protein bL9 n=1 Tax=Hydrogenobacter thermophilus (strain DSM 6534 / IAM 12695 / TK-6) TaxID=608538 RepID=D3DG86_HYDTT|nr:50S ribosomal protein L9 [Hydrogenobacter thermophilus]ADO44773.1 ribosomal protein L9 [Hydrogenobacter thermophilus TK-6]BAI68838.1 ribosomal protein L9 [Hydrogenobacter thermophilus TK-6]